MSNHKESIIQNHEIQFFFFPKSCKLFQSIYYTNDKSNVVSPNLDDHALARHLVNSLNFEDY